MRKEASTEQWRALYEAALRLKDMHPWRDFWDMDLIGVKKGAEEDTVFFNIMGRNGECYAIAAYEGYDSLNSLMLLIHKDSLNLSDEDAVGKMNNLTMYLGGREDLSAKQRKTVRDLGYKFRGKNQWLYFTSFAPGYYPSDLNEDEVIRMTEHLQDLEIALKYYYDNNVKVDFENAEMFLMSVDREKNTRKFGGEPLPFTNYYPGTLEITDEELLKKLKKQPKTGMILEADISVMNARVKDKGYDREILPNLVLVGDDRSQMILSFNLSTPEKTAESLLADAIIDIIRNYGIPKEIRVPSVIEEAALEQLCEACGISLKVVYELEFLSDIEQEMKEQFMM